MKSLLYSMILVSLVASVVKAEVTSVPMDLPTKRAEKSAESNANAGATVVNNNNISLAANQAQELPSTLVEASPLKESRAEQLRKQREAAEQNTELLIVEQLEKDRLDAERRRAQKLFGDKLNDDSQQVEEVQVIAPVVQPIVVATPAPVVAPVVVEDNSQLKSDVSDIKSSIAELKTSQKIEEEKPVKTSKVFIGAIVGTGEYAGVDNVKPAYALGASGGIDYEDGLSLEATYIYSSYDVEPAYFSGPYNTIEMDQTNVGVGVKYRISTGTRVSPVVGALASYTYRNYKEKYSYYGATASSQSIDVGALAGLDIAVLKSQKFVSSISMKCARRKINITKIKKACEMPAPNL